MEPSSTFSEHDERQEASCARADDHRRIMGSALNIGRGPKGKITAEIDAVEVLLKQNAKPPFGRVATSERLRYPPFVPKFRIAEALTEASAGEASGHAGLRTNSGPGKR